MLNSSGLFIEYVACGFPIGGPLFSIRLSLQITGPDTYKTSSILHAMPRFQEWANDQHLLL